MAKLTIGSNSIDVRIGVVAVNGYGGKAGPDGVVESLNPDLVTRAHEHQERQLAAIEEASGRKDGWVHHYDVVRWAWKHNGVNTAIGGVDRAPYLAWRPGLHKAAPVVPSELRDVVALCGAAYVGSTWSGDNRERPRAIAPVHMADVAALFRAVDRIVPPSVKRICFDQASALLGVGGDDGEQEAAFMRVARAFAERGVEVIVEALPKDPRDLAWVSGLSRYANVMGRGLLGKSSDGRLVYPVPRGARVVIAFDGKVVREERGGIDVDHVQRVVEWAAAFGVAGYGAAELELLIVGPGHAKAVTDWAAEHRVL